MNKTEAIAEIESYMIKMKQYRKSLHYRFCANDEAAAAFIRLPNNDSEWTWTVFESVKELCERYPFASPFFNVEDFPYYNVPEIEGYSARYVGVDFSHYQYPEQYPPIENYFSQRAK